MEIGNPIATIDACVLYPAPVRDFLLNLADLDLFRPRWTEEIHDEWTRNLLANRDDLKAESLEKTVENMNDSFDESLVEGHEEWIEKIQIPDPGDRHVVACAIHSDSDVIITRNLKHFPKSEIFDEWGIEVISPDDFVLGLIRQSPQLVIKGLKYSVAKLRKPPKTVDEVLDTLHNQGLEKSVAKLRELLAIEEKHELSKTPKQS